MPTNSLLTDSQREFLRLSEEERKEQYSKQRRSYYRQEIAERVRRGFDDFSILFEHWDEDAREAVLADPKETLQEGIIDVLAMIYAETDPINRFRPYLRRAVKKAEQEYADSPTWRVNVTVNVETPETVQIEEAHNKYRRERLKDLSEAEMACLLDVYRRIDAVAPAELSADEVVERWEGWQDAALERARIKREKQGRVQKRQEEHDEDTS